MPKPKPQTLNRTPLALNPAYTPSPKPGGNEWQASGSGIGLKACKVEDLRNRVSGLGLRGLGLSASELGARGLQGSGFEVQDSGLGATYNTASASRAHTVPPARSRAFDRFDRLGVSTFRQDYYTTRLS